jgi:uncharacterized YigZ family protein
MSNPEFLTLAGTGEAETKVRGSRFIAIAFPTSDEATARAVLDERSRHYFDASHHCAAWRLRDGSWRALDAGEPAGSAGPPILAAIDAVPLRDVAVVVTRYFGGTKLGVGGLVRAYGAAAEAAIHAAPFRRAVHAVRLRARYAHADTSPVMRSLERCGATAIEHGYSADQGAIVTFTVPSAQIESLRSFLTDLTSGRALLEELAETVIYSKAG